MDAAWVCRANDIIPTPGAPGGFRVAAAGTAGTRVLLVKKPLRRGSTSMKAQEGRRPCKWPNRTAVW
ncbi:hypothetical protein WJX74_004311 [Apatococcus lobatus]|uniref:Uncharacterized protein n=1 Tax=Apatococcus lobatus TaxID=904363 RepID=A0AAW1SG91_9CHLO